MTPKDSHAEVSQTLKVPSPMLWSDERPYLYKVVSQLDQGGQNSSIATRRRSAFAPFASTSTKVSS